MNFLNYLRLNFENKVWFNINIFSEPMDIFEIVIFN